MSLPRNRMMDWMCMRACVRVCVRVRACVCACVRGHKVDGNSKREEDSWREKKARASEGEEKKKRFP